MSHTHLFSTEAGTGVSLRLFRPLGSFLLPLSGLVLAVTHAYAQPPAAYTPRELLTTHPREFIEWLQTHQPAYRRLKDLELLCDAFAIVTLQRLAMNPARLVAGVEKITRYNQKLFATRIDDRDYPSVAQRRAFARAITTWLRSGPEYAPALRGPRSERLGRQRSP